MKNMYYIKQLLIVSGMIMGGICGYIGASIGGAILGSVIGVLLSLALVNFFTKVLIPAFIVTIFIVAIIRLTISMWNVG